MKPIIHTKHNSNLSNRARSAKAFMKYKDGLRIKYNLKICLKAFALTFFLSMNLNAQEEEIQFSHLTAEDGLSLSGVTQILQDSRGFLWFGTYNGLNRYDGYNYKIFLPELTNPKSMKQLRHSEE